MYVPLGFKGVKEQDGEENVWTQMDDCSLFSDAFSETQAI
jgi:hypothetical protein